MTNLKFQECRHQHQRKPRHSPEDDSQHHWRRSVVFQWWLLLLYSRYLKPWQTEERCLLNMMSDCIYQGMDSGACTMVEITNYEHRSGGQTVTLNYFQWQIYYFFLLQGVTRYHYVQYKDLAIPTFVKVRQYVSLNSQTSQTCQGWTKGQKLVQAGPEFKCP